MVGSFLFGQVVAKVTLFVFFLTFSDPIRRLAGGGRHLFT
jgi:hypothetical protein